MSDNTTYYEVGQKVSECLTGDYFGRPVSLYGLMTEDQQLVVNAFAGGLLRVQDFVALIVGSGFTNEAAIRCLIDNFALVS